MDQSRSKSPFGIRQIARISLGIVRVEASHPRGESARVSEVTAAARIAPGSGAAQPVSAAMRAIHNANNGAKWNRCIHGPASCWQDATARARRRRRVAGNFNERSPARRACSGGFRFELRRRSAISVQSWRCGGFSSVAAARRKAAPRRSADSRARRYRLARCGRSRAPPNRNNGSSRRRWRRIPWK